MAKSRKTKAKHQDFQKVKLKAGRSLPKSLNETVTAFKAQSIQLRERKSLDPSLPTTARKLNIKVLLSQCRHYSAGARHDALCGLRELLSANPGLLQRHLATVLENTTPLCLDMDANLRQALLRLLRVVMSQTSSSTLQPFFLRVSAHLSCAMTHIQEDVQRDSLLLLDLCVEHYPVLVAEHSAKLLDNFLAQISRPATGIGERSLVINVTSRMSGPQWRHLVLQRLQRFLTAVLDCAASHTPSHTSEVVQWSGERTTRVCTVEPRPCGPYSLRPAAGTAADLTAPHLLALVPLLLQSWLEVCPEQLTGSTMSPAVLSMLDVILSILQLLLSHLDQRPGEAWDRAKVLRELATHFLPYFPYSQHDAARQSAAKKQPKQPQVSTVALNLSVCDVMTRLLPFEEVTSVTWLLRVVDHLTSQLSKQHLSADQVEVCVRAVRRVPTLGEPLISALFAQYTRHHALSPVRTLLTQVLADLLLDPGMCHLHHLPSATKWVCDLPHQLVETASSPPTLRRYLHILTAIARTQHSALLAALTEYSVAILDLCRGCSAGCVGGVECVQRSVIELLWQVARCWGRPLWQAVVGLSREGGLHPATLTYCTTLTVHRLAAGCHHTEKGGHSLNAGSKSSRDENIASCDAESGRPADVPQTPADVPWRPCQQCVVDALSALVSLSVDSGAHADTASVVETGAQSDPRPADESGAPPHSNAGAAVSALSSARTVGDTGPCAAAQLGLREVTTRGAAAGWGRHQATVREVCTCLALLPNDGQVSRLYTRAVTSWLQDRQCVSLGAVHGILSALQTLPPPSADNTAEGCLDHVVDTIVGLVVSTILALSEDEESDASFTDSERLVGEAARGSQCVASAARGPHIESHRPWDSVVRSVAGVLARWPRCSARLDCHAALGAHVMRGAVTRLVTAVLRALPGHAPLYRAALGRLAASVPAPLGGQAWSDLLYELSM